MSSMSVPATGSGISASGITEYQPISTRCARICAITGTSIITGVVIAQGLYWSLGAVFMTLLIDKAFNFKIYDTFSKAILHEQKSQEETDVESGAHYLFWREAFLNSIFLGVGEAMTYRGSEILYSLLLKGLPLPPLLATGSAFLAIFGLCVIFAALSDIKARDNTASDPSPFINDELKLYDQRLRKFPPVLNIMILIEFPPHNYFQFTHKELCNKIWKYVLTTLSDEKLKDYFELKNDEDNAKGIRNRLEQLEGLPNSSDGFNLSKSEKIQFEGNLDTLKDYKAWLEKKLKDKNYR